MGASLASREELIRLEGQWSFAEVEREYLENAMTMLSVKADGYLRRMEIAWDWRANKVNAEDSDEAKKNQALLHLAEYEFAEKAFLELSKQATTFQIRLSQCTTSLLSLTSARNRLLARIDREMLAGRLTLQMPIGELPDFLRSSGTNNFQHFSIMLTDAITLHLHTSYPGWGRRTCMTSTWSVIWLGLVYICLRQGLHSVKT